MTTGKHHIENGDQYSYLFPRVNGDYIDIEKDADLSVTVPFMQEVIADCLDDTRELAKLLKAPTTFETLRNVWNFTFKHLQYEKDEDNKEQIRRPARSWRDRKAGVDCDCLTVFIGSTLVNLGIPFLIRLTGYGYDGKFGHVYPVAFDGKREVIMDCVVHQFNYEEPYKLKKDVTMKLQYLNGFEDANNEAFLFESFNIPEDAEALFLEDEDLEGLEGKAERQERKADRKEKREERKDNKPPLKEQIKNGLHKINKVNPATALLRAGVLASMKLNVGKVAGKLRYSYWSEAEATKRNMQPGKHAQLIQVREKLEKIFYGAGGEPKNLKKSILEGRGNKDKLVGLNGLTPSFYGIDYNDLESVIGSDTYSEEFDQVHGSVQGLGEIISTTTAIASASGIIGTIAGLIKKLGSLFKKGTQEDQQDLIADTTADAESKEIMDTISTDDGDVPASILKTAIPGNPKEADFSALEKKIGTAVEDDDDSDAGSNAKPKSGTQSNAIVKWVTDHPLQAGLIAIVAIGGGVWAYKAYQAKKQKKNNTKPVSGLKGTSKKRPTQTRVERVRLL